MTGTSRLIAIALCLLVGAAASGSEKSKESGVYAAKEIGKADLWINGGPLQLKSLRGKVVLIDFWAFDCEPCIKTMPHIVDLYEKYSPEGLVVIGIHTPRADNERDVAQLRLAVERMGIRFPVAVDGRQKIWRDYLCELWPSQFVIDRKGIVRFSHGGVGRQDEMEEVIARLLRSE